MRIDGTPRPLPAEASLALFRGAQEALDLVPGGWWQRLVFPKDRPEGTVDRNAYVFCVLELFHTGLRHRDIFAAVSDRWSDPRARLLAGSRWDDAKGAALTALQLPEDNSGALPGPQRGSAGWAGRWRWPAPA